MGLPLRMLFVGMAHDRRLVAHAEMCALRLDELDEIGERRVVLEAPSPREARYHARISLAIARDGLAGLEVFDGWAAEPHRAIDAAFADAYRRLEERALAGRDSTKPPSARRLRGVVLSLYAKNGYGFLRGPDGESIYFHRRNVDNGDFARLARGSAVTFVDGFDERGRHACAVALLGRAPVGVTDNRFLAAQSISPR